MSGGNYKKKKKNLIDYQNGQHKNFFVLPFVIRHLCSRSGVMMSSRRIEYVFPQREIFQQHDM